MKPGTLYIIATPIGNIEDITLRALKTLKENVEYIYCEDTRYTKKLLTYYNITLPSQSLHAHSSDSKIDFAVRKLEEGNAIAYLTDSGTPGISDPGAKLVRAARLKGLPIVPIPGPSALTSLLSVAGYPSKNIMFLGFLSKNDNKKRKELTKYIDFKGIIVLFESPYRIKKLLSVVLEVFPDSHITIGREITKMYEEFISGDIKEICHTIENIKELGEFTLAIYTEKKLNAN
ncbi:MAG: 16S rRNA (cytidine(1402)-2'-O)-methyltransferase [Spirochaetes bacterium]|nr:16S rRNA (cytidine(1402)-2'-O)-methyltransferase [Spirochaetota bacterium]